MPGFDKSAAAIEMFARRVQMAYQVGDLIGNNTMVYGPHGPGEVFNHPVVPKTNAPNVAADPSSDLSDAALVLTAPEIDLDNPILRHVYIPEDDMRVRPDLALSQNVARALAQDVAAGKTRRICWFLAKIAANNSNEQLYVNTDTTFGNLGKAVAMGIRKIASSMDEAEVPATDRFAMLKSTEFNSMIEVDGVVRVDYGGDKNTRQFGGNGDVIRYHGFHILNVGIGLGQNSTVSPYNGLSLPTDYQYDASKTKGVLWHGDSWGLREVLNLDVTVDHVPEKQSWLVRAKKHMGTGSIQTDGIYRLYHA